MLKVKIFRLRMLKVFLKISKLARTKAQFIYVGGKGGWVGVEVVLTFEV